MLGFSWATWPEMALTCTVRDVIVFLEPPFILAFIAKWASTDLLSSFATGVIQYTARASLSVLDREDPSGFVASVAIPGVSL